MIEPLYYLVPILVAVACAEAFLLRRKGLSAYGRLDTLGSLYLGLGNLLIGIAFAGLVGILWTIAESHRIISMQQTVVVYIVAFLCSDLMYYAYHRMSHRVRLFWASHVNHHSSNEFNLATALRNTWTGPIAGDAPFKAILVWIGFPLDSVLLSYTIILVYQFLLHTQLVSRLPGPVEFLLNTPSHHRVHHSVNPKCLDKNFGGVLIVWDRMFGSFHDESKEADLAFGAIDGPDKRGLLSLPFHEWASIGRDLRRRRLIEWPMTALGPPGGRHPKAVKQD